LHIHDDVFTVGSAFQQREEDIFVKLFPVRQRVQYFMCSVLLKIGESCNIFAIEDQEGLFEVEMGEVGNQ